MALTAPDVAFNFPFSVIAFHSAQYAHALRLLIPAFLPGRTSRAPVRRREFQRLLLPWPALKSGQAVQGLALAAPGPAARPPDIHALPASLPAGQGYLHISNRSSFPLARE